MKAILTRIDRFSPIQLAALAAGFETALSMLELAQLQKFIPIACFLYCRRTIGTSEEGKFGLWWVIGLSYLLSLCGWAIDGAASQIAHPILPLVGGFTLPVIVLALFFSKRRGVSLRVRSGVTALCIVATICTFLEQIGISLLLRSMNHHAELATGYFNGQRIIDAGQLTALSIGSSGFGFTGIFLGITVPNLLFWFFALSLAHPLTDQDARKGLEAGSTSKAA